MANEKETHITNRKWLRAFIVGLTTLIVVGGGYAAWHHFDVPPLDRYTPLLAEVAAGKVHPDDGGLIDLTKTYPGLTPQDHAYIRWRDDGTFLAMFPTEYGAGSQVIGLLYSSCPLREEDTRPRDIAIGATERLISIGTYQYLIVEKRINPNWYHVSYKLH